MRTVAAVALAACGSPHPPAVTAPPPAPKVVTVDVGPEIVKLGEAWRASPKDTAPLLKLIELARTAKQWRAAVPYIVASFETSEVAVDAAFDATIALNDPEMTAALLTPLSPREWRDSKIVRYETVAAAEKRVGRAMIPAYLAASKLVDRFDIRGRAIEHLASLGAREARPLFLELLKGAPFDERTSTGEMEDPRGFYHLYAIEGLEALGPDPETAEALIAFAFDNRNWGGDTRSAFEALAIVDTAPTEARMARLLACAINPKVYNFANECGSAYGLLADTVAQVEKLRAAPPSNMPYFGDYTEAIKSWRRALACNHEPACLVPLIATLSDRQHDTTLIAKAVRELGLHPDATLLPTVLALVDEVENTQTFEEIGTWFSRLVPGPCGECIAHLEASLARHSSDANWRHMNNTTSASEVFRARQPQGAAVPAAQPIRSVLAAVPAAEHTALRTHQWDRSWFTDDVFGIGRDATEVGSGAETVLGFITKDFASTTSDGMVRSFRGVRGHVMWDAELEITKEQGFAQFTQLVVEDHGVYKVRAWSASSVVQDAEAKAAAKGKLLPMPAPIADVHGDAELDAAARAAFRSRAGYIAALSEQEDAFTFGNYLDDEWPGPVVKAAVKRLPPFRLHDGVHVEKVSDEVGFAAANLELDEATPRVYRVLAVFAKTAGAWKIVQAHWSFGMPIPGVR